MNIEEKLQSCINTLNEIKTCGYWPFASPAPCSTELKIKDNINKATASLESALYWHEQMFSKTGRDPMKVASSIIIEKKTETSASVHIHENTVNGIDIFVLSKIKPGIKCRWIDPEISEYGNEQEQKDALERVFTIEKIIACENPDNISGDDTVLISDGFTEAEVPVRELVIL